MSIFTANELRIAAVVSIALVVFFWVPLTIFLNFMPAVVYCNAMQVAGLCYITLGL